MNNTLNKKKVGVLTMHSVINYGSFLQAYATQEVIKSLNYDCEIIDYKFPNQWHFNNGLEYDKINLIASDLLYKLGITKGHRKKKRILEAINKYLKMSNHYDSPELIYNNPPIYDVYVTGSDQTWNTKHTQGDVTFMLNFAPKGKKRISFSASLARKNLDEKYGDIFQKYLNQYDNISIRDSNGNNIISELTGKQASVTLDPTLILNRYEWSKFAANRKNSFKEKKYIVFYLITHSFDPRPYIYDLLKALQVETGLDVYTFSTIPEEFNIKHKVFSDIHVESFIHLFEGASYVVTSSFHGTAFAVNFGIPLYSVVNDENSGDDRQASLLSKLNISNCLVQVGKEFSTISPEYNVIEQQKKLEELREKSKDYLKSSL